MQAFKTTVLATSLVALTGCASWDKSPICIPSHGWLAWSDVRCNADNAQKVGDDASKNAARLAALEKERKGWPTNWLRAARSHEHDAAGDKKHTR